MSNLKRSIARTPVLGRTLLILVRARIALQYFARPALNLVTWLFRSREVSNFTYGLATDNRLYLASLVAHVAGIDFEKASAYIKEIEDDEELSGHIADATAKSDLAFLADRVVRYGRRVGWYAIARATKPRVIIETGVDKGMGACVLTAALRRNREEGFNGRYYGTDIDPGAGYLLSGKYAEYGTILVGDSIDSLLKFDGMVDLFINDSDHSAEYEAREYAAIGNKLSGQAIVLGDNSHCSTKLLEFSLQTNRQFLFFHEQPRDHWYPGAGIGISFKRR